MQLVDEQDDVPVTHQLFERVFEPLLKLAAVFRPGHHARQIQRNHALLPQKLGDIALCNALCQPLCNGRFAHARLADEYRVILGAPNENLDDPLDLLLSADDGVQLSVFGRGRQIPPEFIQAWGIARRLAAGCTACRSSSAAALLCQADDALLNFLIIHAQLGEQAVCNALPLPQQRIEHVLCSDIA